jgi:dethiobiotin synthetase
MTPHGYFITGTGTGVGKTFTTCALVRRARELGAGRVFAFKPIETGCARNQRGQLVGADQELLCDAAGGWQTGAWRGVYQFEPPVAPIVAAEALGTEIDIEAITSVLDSGSTGADLVVVEGAGGWRVPIAPQLDMAELARRVGFPIIVVACATLGTINHSLLSIEAVERDAQTVAALVLSRHPNDAWDHVDDNAKRIRDRWPGRVLVMSSPSDLDPLLT